MKIALALLAGFATITHSRQRSPGWASTGDKQGGWALFDVGTQIAIAKLVPKINVDFLNLEAYHLKSRRESEGLTVPEFN